MFSRRTSWPRAENAIARSLTRARSAHRSILDLTVSNPTQLGLHDAAEGQALLVALAQPPSLMYEPQPFGGVEARQAVIDFLHRDGAAEPTIAQVCLTASTSEAYSFLFDLLCDPGDAVLVPTPSYPLFDFLADLEGVQLVPYPLRYDGEWHVDLAALTELAANPRVRAVLALHPNNPTGNYLKADELAAIGALCAERALALIADEVFFDFAPPPASERPRHAYEDCPCLTFALGGLSKAAGWPQLKLGFIVAAGPQRLLDEALERLALIADTYLSVGGPVQVALPEILRNAKSFQDRTRARLAMNLAELRQLSQGKRWSVLALEGGWSAVLRLPRTLTSEEWTLQLIEQAVLVQPGYFYELPESYLVISLIVEPDDLARGAALIDAIIER